MELKKNDIGNYVISEKAFKDIANIVCSNIKNIYPTKKEKEFAECKLNKNNDLSVTVALRIKQGVDIVKLCSKIQDEIKESILLMTGIECKRIDIDIQGFENKKK